MIHVTATTFVFGMIAIVDLRLLGLLGRGSAVPDLYRDVIPLTWVAFGVAAVPGFCCSPARRSPIRSTSRSS